MQTGRVVPFENEGSVESKDHEPTQQSLSQKQAVSGDFRPKKLRIKGPMQPPLLKAFPLMPDIGEGGFNPDDRFEPNLEGPRNMDSPEGSAASGTAMESLPRLVIELDLPTAVVNEESGLVEIQKQRFNFGYRAKVRIIRLLLNFV